MLLQKQKKFKKLLALSLLIAFSWSAAATALQAQSSTYGVDEAFFGNGGELNACSTTYCTKQAAGDLAVGNSASASYQTQAGGLVTDRIPSLELIVNNPNADIGILTTTTTHVTSATFSVKSYLAGGYVVQTSSPGPKNGSYTMQGLSSPTGSSIGNEQFGINLKANSCPGAAPALPAKGGCTGSFGANPSQAPDSTFSFGFSAPGYDTADQYKYVDGDIIAKSDTSSGETDYTVSYLYNISNVTPGGTYVLDQSIVATSTF
jgi:hypothetical protein